MKEMQLIYEIEKIKEVLGAGGSANNSLVEDIKELNVKIDNMVKDFNGSTSSSQYQSVYKEIQKIKEQNSIPSISEQLDQIREQGVIFGAALENDGSGWAFAANEQYHNLNFNAVKSNDREIQVKFNPVNSIGSFMVVPNYTYASLGLTCGVNANLDTVSIECFAPLTGTMKNGKLYHDDMFKDTIVLTELDDNTGWQIDYDGSRNANEKVLISNIQNTYSTIGDVNIKTQRIANNKVSLRSYHDLYAYIEFDGENWQVNTSCVCDINCDFKDGALIIEHEEIMARGDYKQYLSVNAIQKKGLSAGLIHMRVEAVTDTKIKIHFYDANGNIITEPTTDMRVFINRPGVKVPHIWNNDMQLCFDLGYTIVRPNNIVTDNCGLWIMGVNQY